jgi:hypothetical protein
MELRRMQEPNLKTWLEQNQNSLAQAKSMQGGFYLHLKGNEPPLGTSPAFSGLP